MYTGETVRMFEMRAKGQAVVAEFVGTFIYVLIAVSAWVGSARLADVSPIEGSTTDDDIKSGFDTGRLLVVAFATGLGAMAAIASLNLVSGGHFNPAITWAAVWTKKMNLISALLYIVMQCLGSILACLTVKAVVPSEVQSFANPDLGMQVSIWQGIVMEASLSGVLVFVFFAVSFDANARVGKMGPLLVGLTIVGLTLAGLGVSGAALNPARALGTAVVDTLAGTPSWDHHYIYWVGPLLGASVSGALFEFVFLSKDPALQGYGPVIGGVY
eukprot:TRINITY_DN6156_c0_g1_i1.p1 TRINITY_DN6156_c0_g1~~TRINITY_DN6156_c0_g1_i1.p1  ORF type:complete len:272 (+),score=20.26 TRINITY_DN6156_c0_g1_i1:164-979(+)